VLHRLSVFVYCLADPDDEILRRIFVVLCVSPFVLCGALQYFVFVCVYFGVGGGALEFSSEKSGI